MNLALARTWPLRAVVAWSRLTNYHCGYRGRLSATKTHLLLQLLELFINLTFRWVALKISRWAVCVWCIVHCCCLFLHWQLVFFHFMNSTLCSFASCCLLLSPKPSFSTSSTDLTGLPAKLTGLLDNGFKMVFVTGCYQARGRQCKYVDNANAHWWQQKQIGFFVRC